MPRREPRTNPRREVDGNRILPSGPKPHSKFIANERCRLSAALKGQVRPSPRSPCCRPLPFPPFHISSAGIFSRSGACTPPLSPATNLPASSVRNDDRGEARGNDTRSRGLSASVQAPQSRSPSQHSDPILRSGPLAARGVTRRAPARFRSLFGSARLDLPPYCGPVNTMWSETCQAELMHVSVGTAGGGRMVSPRHLASRTFFFSLTRLRETGYLFFLVGSGFNVLREREAGRKASSHASGDSISRQHDSERERSMQGLTWELWHLSSCLSMTLGHGFRNLYSTALEHAGKGERGCAQQVPSTLGSEHWGSAKASTRGNNLSRPPRVLSLFHRHHPAPPSP